MSIPLATTTVDITRLVFSDDDDGYSGAQPASTVATDVRANIGSPTTRTDLTGGTRVVTTWRAQIDLCDLQARDIVTDAAGNVYVAHSVVTRRGFGLDHMVAVLTDAEGAS